MPFLHTRASFPLCNQGRGLSASSEQFQCPCVVPPTKLVCYGVIAGLSALSRDGLRDATKARQDPWLLVLSWLLQNKPVRPDKPCKLGSPYPENGKPPGTTNTAAAVSVLSQHGARFSAVFPTQTPASCLPNPQLFPASVNEVANSAVPALQDRKCTTASRCSC